MSKFYSVKVSDKLVYKGCSCGYGLFLGDVVECIAIKMDKFVWINPHTGQQRLTKMGSTCFKPVQTEPIKEEFVVEEVEVVEATETEIVEVETVSEELNVQYFEEEEFTQEQDDVEKPKSHKKKKKKNK